MANNAFDRVEAFRKAGDDVFTAAESVSKPTCAFGDLGNDMLTGGTGNDRLTGRNGVDNLDGGDNDSDHADDDGSVMELIENLI